MVSRVAVPSKIRAAGTIPRDQHGRERGVPVMRVEDVGSDVEAFHGHQRGPDEEGVAHDAVVFAARRRAVKLLAVEVLVRADQKQRDFAVGKFGAEDADLLRSDVKRLARDFRLHAALAHRLPHLAIQRHPHRDVVPELRLRFRQRADDVPKTAAFRKRCDLGGEMRDAHRFLPTFSAHTFLRPGS